MNNILSFSTIDHFLVNPRLCDSIFEAGVAHSSENVSNHSPIYCKINLTELDLSLEEITSRPRINWNKSDEPQKSRYREMLASKLNSIKIPNSCNDKFCSLESHKEETEDYVIEVMKCIESCGRSSLNIDTNSRAKSKGIEGWN